jgi:MFS family permease
MVLGFGICAGGWLLLALAPVGGIGVAAYALMLMAYGFGAVLITINFIALRQSVTPGHLLGRMTTTMRWLILLPAGPGALLGGWLGEHWGLRAALGFAGVTAVLLTGVSRRLAVIRSMTVLPTLKAEAIAPYSAEGDA